jgi:regulator of sigma E protease
MLDLASSILGFIVAVGVLVAVHEYGHFWVARRLGFKVERFSVGFGRPLARWRGKGPDYTEYWLGAIPLGGYVKLLDEREAPVDEADRERSFNRRPVPHRIAVLLAGPGFNFLFAIVAYWLLFVVGVPGLKPVIGSVTEGSIAAEAGLRAQDEIEAIGDRATDTWEHAVLAILDHLLADGQIALTVRGADGAQRRVDLDLRGRVSELTEPDALFTGLGMRPVTLVSFLPRRWANSRPASRRNRPACGRATQ